MDPSAGAGVTAPESLFTAILNDYVADGLVDYGSLCRDDRLDDYVGHLARTSPDTLPSRNHRLAFWINAYNAYTLRVICDNYPVESIHDLHSGGRVIGYLTNRTIWDREFTVVGGKTYSLDDIEHDIIRARFIDPRIHAALVCAARSCPPLRSEAYSGERLDAQLDDQTRTFFSQPDKNRFEPATKTVYLSKIMDWYADDFGADRREVLLWVARYAPREAARSIASDPEAWEIEYTDYDWSLNDR